MIEKISNEAEIESLYKAGSNAPYTKADHGYLGVLLIHKETGKIHCHICGGWFKSLGQHSVRNHHIKSRDYKIRYGFALTQPLCSQELSKTYRAITLENIKNGVMNNGRDKEWMKKMQKQKSKRKSKKTSHFTDSTLNSKNICNEQLKRRVFAIAENANEDVSSHLIKKHDSGLLSVICRRFGSWNDFLIKNDMPLNNKFQSLSSDAILLQLKDFWKTYSIKPSAGNWRKKYKKHGWVTDSVIVRRFGSWNRALHNAGLFYSEA